MVGQIPVMAHFLVLSLRPLSGIKMRHWGREHLSYNKVMAIGQSVSGHARIVTGQRLELSIGGSMIEQALEDVRAAHDDIDIKESEYQDGVGDRGRAIVVAYQSGCTAAEIALTCGLAPGQVLDIIEAHEDLPEAQF